MTKNIFILGAGRSGTHLMAKLLESSPSVCKVTYEKPELFRRSVRIASRPDTKEVLYPELTRIYQRITKKCNGQYYADKSHPNIWFAEDLANTFPDCVFLAMSRNVYSVVASMLQHASVLKWEQNWEGYPFPNPFIGVTKENVKQFRSAPIHCKCAYRWLCHRNRIIELKKKFPDRLLVVNYDKLIASNAEVRRVEAFLKLEKPMKSSMINRKLPSKRKKLSKSQMSEINKIVS